MKMFSVAWKQIMVKHKSELFVSASRLREQRPQPRRKCLGSSAGEDGFSVY
jgi:hypothetical protein